MRRVWHPYWDWECWRAGFFANSAPKGYTPETAKIAYCDFLADVKLFESAMRRVELEWPNSCDHFLTNDNINRIAWLGQAAMCIHTGVPSAFRGGFKMLDAKQQRAANNAAGRFLLQWISKRKQRPGATNMYANGEVAGMAPTYQMTLPMSF